MPIQRCLLVAIVIAGFAWEAMAANVADLSKGVIVHSGASARVQKAVDMLREEISARSGVLLETQEVLPDSSTPALVVGVTDTPPMTGIKAPAGLSVPAKAEGYALWVDTQSRKAPTVYLVGQDDRGVLFAVGRLLRLLHLSEGSLTLDEDVRIATAPVYPIRGHQLGYRNTANSYDAWDVKQFEQYIRDLIVFGANCIELIPSIDPEEREGPHMKMSMWDMTVALSALLDEYGLDVWFWLPVGDGDVSDPAVSEKGLSERRALFEACRRVDDIFVPGGDPGDTPPAILMPWLKNLADTLHESHPDAGLWVSNQGFTPEQNDVFFAYLQREEPDWLAGVVFGPWAKISMQEERERTPAKYPIRRYPDITHTVRCQYPVPQWDRAFARTLGREPFNPRPHAMARIHGLFAPLAVGASTYSDGINDDVNKALWASLEWAPGVDTDDIVMDYARYFLGEAAGPEAAKGINAFEANWEGPLATHTGIEANLRRWQDIEKNASAMDLAKNWRLQLCLLRAYYDAYVQRRLLLEERYEQEACDSLREAGTLGVSEAIVRARAAFAQADAQPEPLQALRRRLEELGASLFKSIGMQLDVKNYQARSPERGAVLEFLDEPLNNRAWFESEFAAVAVLDSQDAQSERVDALLNWEHPGEGSFYDDLGNATKQPHLLASKKTWEDDPGGVESTQEEFSNYEGARLSWGDQAQTLFGEPLRMRYAGLDPEARYRLRVTYAGRFRATMRLEANESHLVHDALPQPSPLHPVEFALPRDLTKGGDLTLEWNLVEGRGCQVAEVWLIKE